jgi:hypothetical protein
MRFFLVYFNVLFNVSLLVEVTLEWFLIFGSAGQSC